MNPTFYFRFLCDCDRISQRDSSDGFHAWAAGYSLDNHTEQALTS